MRRVARRRSTLWRSRVTGARRIGASAKAACPSARGARDPFAPRRLGRPSPWPRAFDPGLAGSTFRGGWQSTAARGACGPGPSSPGACRAGCDAAPALRSLPPSNYPSTQLDLVPGRADSTSAVGMRAAPSTRHWSGPAQGAPVAISDSVADGRHAASLPPSRARSRAMRSRPARGRALPRRRARAAPRPLLAVPHPLGEPTIARSFVPAVRSGCRRGRM